MSIGTYGYAVDLDDLIAKVASRDSATLSEIQSQLALRSSQSSSLNDQLGDAVSDAEALRMILEGDFSDDSNDARAQRLYALEILCSHFGRRLDGQSALGYLEDLLWDTKIKEVRNPLGLKPASDFPIVGYLTAREAAHEYAAFKDEDVEFDDTEASDAHEEFVWWLKQCADGGSGLVAFTY